MAGIPVVAVAALLFLADVVLPDHGRGVPLALFTALGVLLILDGVRTHRPASTLPWYLLVLSVALPGAAMVIQTALGRSALDLPPASHALVVVGMATSILAFTLFVRARTRVLDRYQILDLGIVVTSASLALSQLVLEPLMDADPPVGISRGLSTVYMLMTLVIVVLAARFVTMPGRRGRAVWALAGVSVGTVVASIVANATATADGGGLRIAWTLMVLTAVTVVAARHRSMVELTEPATGEAPSFGLVRVTGLGLALFLTPLTAVLVHHRTSELDVLTTLGPGAVVTVLVMVRLRLLFAREQAAREAVHASREAFSALIHGISDVIAVVDADGAIAYATESAGKVLGRPPDVLTGRRLTDLVHPDDAVELAGILAGLPGSGMTVDRTVRLPVEGTERVFELEASDRADHASLRGVVVVLHDVTDRHLLEGELRRQALHDPLTGLPNRALLVERVRAAVATGAETSALFIDLDDFKHVNDGLGHHAGDLLLCAVAGRLLRTCREGDTIARLGGDEFAVLVVDHQEQGTPRAVAVRVLEALAAPFEVAGQRISVGASVGVASGVGLDDETLLRRADVAMYRAKAAGKGTLAVFEPGMEEPGTARLWLHVDEPLSAVPAPPGNPAPAAS